MIRLIITGACGRMGRTILQLAASDPAFIVTHVLEMRRFTGAKAVISPNMSIGVNLLFTLTERAARALGRDYDPEIIEMHHKWKKDAPSGTAKRLKDLITGTAPDRGWVEVTGRHGITGERKSDEIGVLSL